MTSERDGEPCSDAREGDTQVEPCSDCMAWRGVSSNAVCMLTPAMITRERRSDHDEAQNGAVDSGSPYSSLRCRDCSCLQAEPCLFLGFVPVNAAQ